MKDDVIDIEALASRLLLLLNKNYKDKLVSRYKIETTDDEGYELLKGRKSHGVISGGEVNAERAAITVRRI